MSHISTEVSSSPRGALLSEATKLQGALIKLSIAAKEAKAAKDKVENEGGTPNQALMVAYQAIFDAVHEMQKSAAQLEQMMQGYLGYEGILNNASGSIHLETATAAQLKKMSFKDISGMQTRNSALQNEIAAYGDVEQIGQQKQQIDLSHFNSYVGSIQQVTQQASFFCNILTGITQQIGSTSQGG